MDFRGASAASFAAVRAELDSVAAQGDLARVADDLFTVAVMLRDEPALRRVATDVSLRPEAKQGLVEEILGSRVSAGALAVVKTAVAQRWTATRDLPNTLQRVSEIAVVLSTEDADRLAHEVFAAGEVVRSNPELRDVLSDPARSTADKTALVDQLFGAKVSPATSTLLKQALAGNYRTLNVALESYRQVVAEVNDRLVATVRVAKSLSEADQQRLTSALSGQYDRPVHLDVVVDPAVIGGLRVEIGHDVIDGTVAGRLDEARRQLAG
ncbi:F0F1 ATP synthase subunit delta [Nocardioides massiliensis]|uniref:ATP synthase subunit delta n=1 Tax=Nocardioides massiliensis TaxID=1325935 RepID=A0ABT9NTT4_9ACTN|nr:F0F1 ATP synthase subunit delta [Nocardioides massiliensis]MDP9823837.1 F-type H+-transporting ATPase subunit delta [Nocardioides massiliensis]